MQIAKYGALALLCLAIAGCSAPATATPIAERTSVPSQLAPTPQATSPSTKAPPTVEPAAPTQMATVQTPLQMTQPSVAASPVPIIVALPKMPATEPTRPAPANSVDIATLALGEPGSYQNLVYGYQVTYPDTWHTGFGNRPVVALFSDMDPAEANRETMRAEGCLVEIRATTNLYDMSLLEIQAQLPRAFQNAQEIAFGGQPALLVTDEREALAIWSRTVYAEHEDHLFILTIEYAPAKAKACLAGWQQMLDTWTWFKPAVVYYKDKVNGYGIAVPHTWYAFSRNDTGIWLSSSDPELVYASDDPLSIGMLVRTVVHENEADLDLARWVLLNGPWQSLTSQIATNGLVGIRSIGPSARDDILQVSGYFMGPLGRVIEVTCLYPADFADTMEPIANEILFSFTY